MNKALSRYPTDWKEIALTIKEREGWHCHRCGIRGLRPGERLLSPKDRAHLIQVHHWDFNPENNSPENLGCVCTPCHLLLHIRRHGSITPGQVAFVDTEIFRAVPQKAIPIPTNIIQLKIPIVTIQLELFPSPVKVIKLPQYKTQLSLPLAI